LFTAVSAFNWNINDAQQYLFYSYAAYCNTDKVADWSCKWCSEPSVIDFEPIAFPYDRKIDGYGYIGIHHTNQTIVVAFRGSHDIRNYIIDLESIVLTPYKNMTGIEVGDGFYKEWNDLLPQVVPVVQDLVNENPTYDVWVTGHSLGAAVSILCAVELAEQKIANISVYNYGLPRVGNQAFSEYYNSLVPQTYRVVNGHDIVPHIPFESMGFYQVPTEVWENPAECEYFKQNFRYFINNHSKTFLVILAWNFTVCNGSGEDPSCSDSQFLDLSVYDHLHYLGYYEDCVDY